MALDSDDAEEPSPEAMARYLSMRRHTVGVPDPRYSIHLVCLSVCLYVSLAVWLSLSCRLCVCLLACISLLTVFFSVRTEMQEDLQKLPPGFPRVAPQPPFPMPPTMGHMHTLMPTQNPHLQPTQQLEYKVRDRKGCVFGMTEYSYIVLTPLSLSLCPSRSSPCCSPLPCSC